MTAEGRIEASHRSFDFRVSGVSDQNDVPAFPRVTLHLHVNLRNERTRRIEHDETALLGLLFDRARHAVC